LNKDMLIFINFSAVEVVVLLLLLLGRKLSRLLLRLTLLLLLHITSGGSIQLVDSSVPLNR